MDLLYLHLSGFGVINSGMPGSWLLYDRERVRDLSLRSPLREMSGTIMFSRVMLGEV